MLMAVGRNRAGHGSANFDRLGKGSSVDVRAKYL
jgi:hypothetical protein